MTVGESRKKTHEQIAVKAHLTLVHGQFYLASGLVDETVGRKLLQLHQCGYMNATAIRFSITTSFPIFFFIIKLHI